MMAQGTQNNIPEALLIGEYEHNVNYQPCIWNLIQ